MSKYTRFLAGLLTICLAFSMLGMNVSADDGGNYTGARPRNEKLERRTAPEAENLTEEQLAIKQKKLANAASLQEPQSAQPAAVTWSYIKNLGLYAQTTGYYCGPACVQAILMQKSGSTLSQAQIAAGCGTTTSGTYLSRMVTFLNNQLSNAYYVEEYFASKVKFFN